MTEQGSQCATFPDFPSKYWATLSHHGHHSPSKLTLTTEFERLNVDKSADHDAAYFSDFTYHKTLISPSTRTCSSLLSEMLRPTAGSRESSPATTHVEGLSDHGSFSTHSTPPLQATPPKHGATMLGSQLPVLLALNDPASTQTMAPKVVRHISFGGVTTSPVKKIANTSGSVSGPENEQDHPGEATPIAKRCIQFMGASGNPRQSLSRVSSGQSEIVASDDAGVYSARPKAIRFASSSAQVKSVDTSRRSSYSDGHFHTLSGDECPRARSAQASSNSSPVLAARAGPATCKSTLETVLKKEAIAKVIDTVVEEEEEDEAEEDLDDVHEEDDEDDENEQDEILSILELDSDDDGYQEDVESDDELIDDDVYPLVQATDDNKTTLYGVADTEIEQGKAGPFQSSTATHVYRTAAPSETDLPDTTDFAPGNMDEHQPACIAFDMAIKDREARRRPAKPSDIDPTFPDSGSEQESDLEGCTISPTRKSNGRQVCRSPPATVKTTSRQRWNSPPLAKTVDLHRARSMPRRTLPSRKGLYEPKPQRAVTIKQSNEHRAQRRREKTEVRHNLRRGKQEVDHNGHEKMKVHCLSRKRVIAAENPCVIRPVMSI